MNMTRKIVTVVSAALIAGSASVVQADKWDLPVPYGETTHHTKNTIQFAEEVAAATNGELTMTVHSAGSLFKHPEIKNAVRQGLVPIGEILLSRLSNENPIFNADSVPFLATSFDDAKALWDAQRPYVEELFEKEGLIVLYAVPWPPQSLWTKKGVDALGDLAGSKFRAYNVATETLAGLAGMVPTQVEGPDVPQAFSTGRVDAMITSPTYGASLKAWDFVSNYTAIDAWLPKNIVFVNAKAFRRLDKDTQKAIMDAAVAAEARGFGMAAQDTATAVKTLAENGMTVAQPSETLQAELQEIGAKMATDWVEAAGDAGKAMADAVK